MPDGRFLNKSISVNEQLASDAVPLEAALFFTWAIPHLDVDGRLNGNPRALKSLICPMRDEITAAAIPDLIRTLSGAGLVRWYELGGQKILAFPGFRTQQRGMKPDREAKSKFPEWTKEAKNLAVAPLRAPDPPSSSGLKIANPDEVRTNSGLANSGLGPDEVRPKEVKRSEVKGNEFKVSQDATANAVGASAVVENSEKTTGEPTDGDLMALIRKRFYAPDGKPPTSWDEGREFSIFKELHKAGFSGQTIADRIEGAAAIRDDDGFVRADMGRVDFLKRDAKMTMRCLYHTKSGVLELWQLAEIKMAELSKTAKPGMFESGSVKSVLQRALAS